MYEYVRLGHPDGEHPCCRVAWRDDEPYQCGQWCGHDGDCTWWTPGGYLPPPLITPLAWLAVGWPHWGPLWRVRCCPICGAGVRDIRAEFTRAIYCDAENAERDEVRWEFGPCGCVGRELAVDSP